MILTGPQICREHRSGKLTIEPFTAEQVNPNSYNFRLGRTLRVYRDGVLDPRLPHRYDDLTIPDEGLVLQPGRLYLAHTDEVLGSSHYAPTFAARSSVARLGLFINLSASLGDIGFIGQWTLQLYAVNPIRVYPGMCIGQMMWWKPLGQIRPYAGKYQHSTGPRSSAIHLDLPRQLAAHRLPGLTAHVDPGEVGGKFATLAALSRHLPVPDAFVVPVREYTTALTADQQQTLAHAFADLRGTVGADPHRA